MTGNDIFERLTAAFPESEDTAPAFLEACYMVATEDVLANRGLVLQRRTSYSSDRCALYGMASLGALEWTRQILEALHLGRFDVDTAMDSMKILGFAKPVIPGDLCTCGFVTPKEEVFEQCMPLALRLHIALLSCISLPAAFEIAESAEKSLATAGYLYSWETLRNIDGAFHRARNPEQEILQIIHQAEEIIAHVSPNCIQSLEDSVRTGYHNICASFPDPAAMAADPNYTDAWEQKHAADFVLGSILRSFLVLHCSVLGILQLSSLLKSRKALYASIPSILSRQTISISVDLCSTLLCSYTRYELFISFL